MNGNTKSQLSDKAVLIPLAGAITVIFVPFAEINPLEWLRGWGRQDYLNLAVAIGTTLAATAAFWGVRAAEKTQQLEWGRQEGLTNIEREERHRAIVANLYDHIMRTATAVWSSVQEMDMLRLQAKRADREKLIGEVEQIEEVCASLGRARHFSRQIEPFFPKAESQIALSDLQCTEIEEAGRRFGSVFDNVVHALSGSEIKSQMTGRFGETEIRILGRLCLQLALYAESIRINGRIPTSEWELLHDVVSFTFPDYPVPEHELPSSMIVDLLVKVSDHEHQRLDHWRNERGRFSPS